MDLQQEEQLKEQRDAIRQSREILARSDFKSVVDTPEGRRVLRLILAQCGNAQISFRHGDQHLTAFKEGQRNIGLWLMNQLETYFPDQYIQLLTEDVNDRRSD